MKSNRKSNAWRRAAAFAIALMALTALLILFWWLREINRSGKGYFYVSNSKELEAVPWYENSIRISDDELTDEQLSGFLQTNSISELRLDRAKNITSKGLVGLEHSWRFRVLGVPGGNVDDSISETLAKLHYLERLSLDGTRIHELSDEAFTNNPDLWMLDVGRCQINRRLLERCAAHPTLSSLNLAHCTGVRDEDFAALAKSSSLEQIDLMFADVSLSVLEEICSIPTLRQLWILYAKGVNAAEVKDLQRRHPGMEIAYEEP
ncbi:MAG: hypothetical protein KDB32_09645 [Planctomycetes bacterium]|nr:hypothetical protein [Planctomycetota bacterium]MCA8945977.1 hypothetical protein [Planctomycetota bacterium]